MMSVNLAIAKTEMTYTFDAKVFLKDEKDNTSMMEPCTFQNPFQPCDISSFLVLNFLQLFSTFFSIKKIPSQKKRCNQKLMMFADIVYLLVQSLTFLKIKSRFTKTIILKIFE